MFRKIFIKEVKEQLKSLSILILIVSIFLFYYTQFICDMKVDGIKPAPPRVNYSNENTSGEEQSYNSATLEELIEYTYKSMKADYELESILRIKGINMSYEKINEEQRQILAMAIEEMEKTNFQFNQEYDAFIEKVDKALGGNTIYSEENNFSSFMRTRTSNEDMELYNTILKEDKVTGAYGRIFADYIGISIGFFTVFVTAFTLTKDKRYNSNELIYTTSVSSYKYILGKYLANILVTSLIVFIVAGHATWQFHDFSMLTGDNISYTAFFKYSILWIIPTIMFITSLSYVLQLIFDNGIVPIIVQFFYWLHSMTPLTPQGVQPTKYFIRFNRVIPYSQFQPFIKYIYLNRILFTVFSLVLLFVAIKLWDRKRGDINNGFSFRKKGILQ
ncbi:ABC transporter permease [Proteiniborus sp. MB09-C3]|uniref:ABC transporter permease n=1 Tax=Proteiniborus sp. MB09-C3 TaxID=3050072 RepID=UPI00255630FF|nr:ABC transporter permease [Proteiniborus sp. MB09-C3]WIV11929.1 ABC transporter permease [Proteiniborus sp. MB09-C3]